MDALRSTLTNLMLQYPSLIIKHFTRASFQCPLAKIPSDYVHAAATRKPTKHIIRSSERALAKLNQWNINEQNFAQDEVALLRSAGSKVS
jgi:hypothetical protein